MQCRTSPITDKYAFIWQAVSACNLRTLLVLYFQNLWIWTTKWRHLQTFRNIFLVKILSGAKASISNQQHSFSWWENVTYTVTLWCVKAYVKMAKMRLSLYSGIFVCKEPIKFTIIGLVPMDSKFLICTIHSYLIWETSKFAHYFSCRRMHC